MSKTPVIPDHAQYTLPEALRGCLHQLAAQLPDFEYSAFCADQAQQAAIRQQLATACPALFAETQHTLQTGLAQRPYFMWIKGLPMDDRGWSLILLSLALGDLVRTTGQEDQEVHNEPEGVRLKLLHQFTDFHTDNSNALHPNDYTALACVRPDQFGAGESIILDMETILAEVGDDHALLEALRADFPWIITSETDGSIRTEYFPVIDAAGDLRWARKNIFAAARIGSGTLTSGQEKHLLAFEKLVQQSQRRYCFGLQAGDILIVNNRKALHARTPIPHMSQTQRKFVRTKIHRG